MPTNFLSEMLVLRNLMPLTGLRAAQICLLSAASMFGALLAPVAAHDWYTGIRNPSSGVGCCGGTDCFALRLDELGRLSEDEEHYIIDGKWRFPKADAMPAREIKEGESGYAYCIWGGKP